MNDTDPERSFVPGKPVGLAKAVAIDVAWTYADRYLEKYTRDLDRQVSTGLIEPRDPRRMAETFCAALASFGYEVRRADDTIDVEP